MKDNESKTYDSIYKIMLPSDYIAMKISDEIKTTVSSLSKGILWDFRQNEILEESYHNWLQPLNKYL